jgi:hypothetical protein
MTLRPPPLVAIAALCVFPSLHGAEPVAAQQVSSSEPVAWVLVVDDPHLDFRNTGRMRDVLRTILRDLVTADDVVAIKTTGMPAISTDLDGRDATSRSVTGLVGGGLRIEQVDLTDAVTVREVRLRASRALSAVVAAATLLGQGESRRRAVILLSNGYSSIADV